jgi:threonine dehydrogenase-like Zn-dependent dehydrogenase
MLQITLEQPGRFTAGEAAAPRREEGDALVRIRRIGVCGTDLHAFRGRQPYFSYPRILGHELAGVVLEVGPNDRGIRPGDRVAVEPYLSCGECRPCRTGRYNCCAALQVLGVHRDGGMRELLSVPVHLLHRSERLTLDQLALIETLGIGYHAVERAPASAANCSVARPMGPAPTTTAHSPGWSPARSTAW